MLGGGGGSVAILRVLRYIPEGIMACTLMLCYLYKYVRT